MAYTTQASYGSAGFSPVVAPIPCRRVTARELATDTAPVSFLVAAPAATNQPYPHYPAETVVFEAGPGARFQAGDVVGYIKTIGSSATFAILADQ